MFLRHEFVENLAGTFVRASQLSRSLAAQREVAGGHELRAFIGAEQAHWITAEVIDGWSAVRRSTPGGQATYSDGAV